MGLFQGSMVGCKSRRSGIRGGGGGGAEKMPPKFWSVSSPIQDVMHPGLSG